MFFVVVVLAFFKRSPVPDGARTDFRAPPPGGAQREKKYIPLTERLAHHMHTR